MYVADLPPLEQERVVCSVSAAVRYQVPANIILAIAADLENGKPGQVVCKNENGTCDVGPVQFNTGYLKELAKYGISPQDVTNRGCYPYELAAWRLARHIRYDHGDLWTKAANYHSRTPKFNQAYRTKLIPAAMKWAKWLAARVTTYEVADSR